MDDANLNGTTDVSQGAEADLGRIVESGDPRIGTTRSAAPTPLEGGITNRNYRARFGETDYVIRVPGKDTNLLEIDREARGRGQRQAPPQLGVAPPWPSRWTTQPRIVTEFVTGRGMSSEELREPSIAEQGRRRARARSTTPPTAASLHRLRLVPSGRDLREDRRATAALRIPDAYEEAHGHGGADRGSAHRPRARAGPLPQRPPGRQLHPRRRRPGAGSSTGSTPGMGDRYFDLAQLRRQQRAGRQRRATRCCAAYFDETPSHRAARRAAR